MTQGSIRIVPLTRARVRACEDIVAVSEPWKTLRERIHFLPARSGERSGVLSYVCTVGAETAGFILFSPDPVFARGGYLRAIGVSPRFRGQGIGKRLLSFAEKTAAKRSLNFFLCVSSFNRGAQAFYKACGYTRAGKLPGLIVQGVSEYIYWKRLRRAAPGKRTF
jgi:ribosomal protein S18 acetylase RimI-like enzyme